MSLDTNALALAGLLTDAVRQRMYAFVRRAGRPVTREEAAQNAGVSRKLAAFHLDKLVASGLLRARYEAIAGRRRAGRTPKVYEPTDMEIRLAIPERRHEVIAGILVDAVGAESPRETAREAALRLARERGREAGVSAVARRTERTADRRRGAEPADLERAARLLRRYGFEPEHGEPALVRLRNCPFHPLASQATDLVCGMNQAFVAGMLDGLGAATVDATLAPTPNSCCVLLRARDLAG